MYLYICICGWARRYYLDQQEASSCQILLITFLPKLSAIPSQTLFPIYLYIYIYLYKSTHKQPTLVFNIFCMTLSDAFSCFQFVLLWMVDGGWVKTMDGGWVKKWLSEKGRTLVAKDLLLQLKKLWYWIQNSPNTNIAFRVINVYVHCSLQSVAEHCKAPALDWWISRQERNLLDGRWEEKSPRDPALVVHCIFCVFIFLGKISPCVFVFVFVDMGKKVFVILSPRLGSLTMFKSGPQDFC